MQLQDAAKEIALWRRKKASLAVMSVTTIVWLLLQVYGFNFLTLASWASIFTLTCLFLYGNILRLLHKSDAEVRGEVRWEVTEEAVKEAAESGKREAEELIRWMFRVSAQREWYVFGAHVVALLLLSYVACFFDFLSLLCAGVMVGMTVPVMYMRYEGRIREIGDRGRAFFRRVCDKFDERVVRKISHKVNGITGAAAESDGVKVDHHPHGNNKTD